MNKLTSLLLIVVAMLFSGCSMAPEYIRPEAPVPSSWPQGGAYAQSSAAVDSTHIPDMGIREFFGDEKLIQVIEIALKNNRDLRLAALNVERARDLYGIQRAELYPAVNGSGAWAKQRQSKYLIEPGSPRTVEQYAVNLGVASWEIDLFGRIQSLRDQALEEYLAAEEVRRGAGIALVSQVARVYLALAADRENLELSRATLEAQQNAYDLIQNQYDAGLATRLDLRRAQTQVEEARVDIARFTQVTAQDENALNLLAGAKIPQNLLPADLSSVTPPKEFFPALTSEALFNRPDIIAAEHRLAGANAYIGAARAAFFPRISLTTALGTASAELSDLFSSGSGTWSFAPQVVMPIFDARTWAALRVSKSNREILAAQYEKTIQAAFREVADALAVQGTMDRRIEAQEALFEAVSETYELSKKRYDDGIDSYLGVLDAHRYLYASQQGLVSLRLARLANQVTLYSVLGGGGEAVQQTEK